MCKEREEWSGDNLGEGEGDRIESREEDRLG